MLPGRVELKLSLRTLRRTPLLTATAVVSLAVGIGLCVAAFAVVYGVFYRNLPVPNGDRVMALQDYDRMGGWRVDLTREEFDRRRAELRSFTDIAGYRVRGVLVADDDEGGRVVSAAAVTSNLFGLLSTPMLAGRDFTEADAERESDVVLVNERLLGLLGLTAAEGVGTRIIIDSRAHEIIGVLPRDFRFPYVSDLWLPLPSRPVPGTLEAGPVIEVIGRLAGGVRAREAAAELAVVAGRAVLSAGVTAPGTRVVRFTRASADPEQIRVLWAAVVAFAFLMAVTAANVAILLAARTAVRARELALCAALGASRRRTVTLLVLEAVVLAAVGAALGLVGGQAAVAWFAEVGDLPFWADLRIDLPVFAFAALATALAAIIAGVLPARRATAADPVAVLAEGHSLIRFGRVSGIMIALEIAVAVGFLGSASSLGRGLMAFGFDDAVAAERILVAQLYFGQPPELQESGAPTDAATRRALWSAFSARAHGAQQLLRERLEAEPLVRATALGDHFPGNTIRRSTIEIDGATGTPVPGSAAVVAIGEGFAEVLEMAVLRGRTFHAAELTVQPSGVTVVNETFARNHVGSADPIGRRIRIVDRGSDGPTPGPWLEIVGVVPDFGLNPGNPAQGDGVYVPLQPTTVVRLALRTDGNPRALVPLVHRAVLDLGVVPQVQWVMTLADQLAEPVRVFRGLGIGLTALGSVALLLAAAGVHALLALAVTQRRREIAIRVALGSPRAAVIRSVLARTGRHTVIGLMIGALLAFATARLVAFVPFELARGGSLAVAVTAALVVGAGLAACIAPVRRALTVQPMDLLRHS